MRESFFKDRNDIRSPDSLTLRPSLWIRSGAQFGHRGGILARGKHRVLVESPTEVFLETGLHLIVAPNGSGKTTLLRTLAGLHPLLKGNLEVSGVVHYVSDQLEFDTELCPRSLFKAWFGRGETLEFCNRLGEMLQLDVDCQIRKLSRGNRQKVLLIAAETLAMVSGRSVLFLDEPLAGMDEETCELVAAFWASSSASILRLVVLHEVECVRKADSLFTVTRGQLRHTYRQTGSWMETCRRLRGQ